MPNQVSGKFADRDVSSSCGVREIRDATAVTIAAMYQSPGSVGRVLSQLASTGQCGVQELLDDIAATVRDLGVPAYPGPLDALATWAINHPSRNI